MMQPGGSDTGTLLERARRGDRHALSRLISQIERGQAGNELVNSVMDGASRQSHVIGVTGPPGAGKSTLVSRLVYEIRARGEEVAVLAVDPSSARSGGAVLGDRIRMSEHTLDPGVFIRSLANRGALGGLATAISGIVPLLGAAGFPIVVIETVGVGQAEVAIASEADTTVVVLIPGAGDAVQAAKAGVLEIADIFVINKADLPGTESLHRAIDQLIEFSHQPGWLPRVVETSCFSGRGLDNLWRALAEHREYLSATDTTEERRVQRLSLQIDQTIEQRLRERVRNAIPDDVRKADIDALLAGSANLNEVIEHLWEIVITSLHQAQL